MNPQRPCYSAAGLELRRAACPRPEYPEELPVGARRADIAHIKPMTDGILLAETQGDRELRQYYAIIIDEAHQRSLNIDFLLGNLSQPKWAAMLPSGP